MKIKMQIRVCCSVSDEVNQVDVEIRKMIYSDILAALLAAILAAILTAIILFFNYYNRISILLFNNSILFKENVMTSILKTNNIMTK